MPFDQYLTAEDQAEFRQAIGDLTSGTFGQHDVIFNASTVTDGVFGESPVIVDNKYPLKGFILTPEAMVKEGMDRSQIDWDLSVMFNRDYLENLHENEKSLKLNGSGYASGSITDIFNNNETWFDIRFRPDFDSDDDDGHIFFDSESTKRHFIFKDELNKLVGFAGLPIIEVTHADYAGIWSERNWNDLRVGMKASGNSEIYLNGTKLNNTISAGYTKGTSALITIGVIFTLANKFFEGKIDYIRVANSENNLDGGTYLANWEFNGDYKDGQGANDLSEGGTGNSFETSFGDLVKLMQPENVDRGWTFIIDNLDYRIKNFRWDAQFVDDYLLVYADLEKI